MTFPNFFLFLWKCITNNMPSGLLWHNIICMEACLCHRIKNKKGNWVYSSYNSSYLRIMAYKFRTVKSKLTIARKKSELSDKKKKKMFYFFYSVKSELQDVNSKFWKKVIASYKLRIVKKKVRIMRYKFKTARYKLAILRKKSELWEKKSQLHLFFNSVV